ncbi:MAG: PQQ-binding-like beta-propeller repeat protein [Patescibacteria group bacterium]|nr:PQQ-binding-like beta-propeller repeat protein [Patescibacteria group bacterium]
MKRLINACSLSSVNAHRTVVGAIAAMMVTAPSLAADWPTWRYDAGRTAVSPDVLPEELHVQWVRHYPPLEPAYRQVRQERVQFDLGYEPVVMGKTMFVGSSRNDRVTALDTDTGEERWRFYAEGPVRLAPAAWAGKVYCASDDGLLYCLDATTGKLLWKHRAAPSRRRAIGNGRLISVWPVRGGPVVSNGRVFLAAGVWPFEGIFVWALDAETGRPIWVNDRCGSLYIEHPHAAMAFGGPSPQGYLLVRGNELVVPSSRAFPAYFDLETGELLHFDFGHGGHGSRPGSWFVATNPEGELLVDPELNTEIHDAGQQVIGQSGARPKPGEVLAETVAIGRETYRLQGGSRWAVSAGGRELRFADGVPGVEGEVHTMLAADGKLFVVTREGVISCFGPRKVEPKAYPLETGEFDRPSDDWAERAGRMLAHSGAEEGYAIVLGLGTGRLAEELVRQSSLHVVVFEPDEEKAARFRRKYDAAGLYGERIVIHAEGPVAPLPPYLANLIAAESLVAERIGTFARGLVSLFAALRPYGGTLCLETSSAEHELLTAKTHEAKLPGAEVRREDGLTLVVRAGPLPGATDYRGRPNYDARVRTPLGLLWFGDTFHKHKLYYKTFFHEAGRGLPETIEVVGGVMKYEVTKEPYGPNPPGIGYHDYLRLLEREKVYTDGYTDVYTGRVLSEAEAEQAADVFTRSVDATAEEAAIPPEFPTRRNPLTGKTEAREMIKTYGCDLWRVSYGDLFTFRSGTAAYYDNRLESGTINISGVRSGCRNSAVPACGVLTLPSWTGNCTCNYPVFTSLALAPMSPEFEQWAAWGDVAAEAPLRRVGINLGAPGDRVDESGLLWLDSPSVGGPSPNVPVRVEPDDVKWFYRHALWMEGGQGWPWVTASGVTGLTSLRIEPVVLKPNEPAGAFSVRWLGFVEPEHSETYTFHARADHGVRLWIADELVLDNGKNLRRGDVAEVTGEISLEAGKRYQLRMEYYQAADRAANAAAIAELAWSSPSVAKAAIPASRLSTAEGEGGGLTGLYYETAALAGPAVVQTDAQLRFNWGRDLPAALRRLPRPLQLPERTFTVRLYFAEPEVIGPGERVFSVRMQGREVLADFDVAREAGGPNRSVAREFRGIRISDALTIAFVPKTAKPALVCGVALVEEE